MKSPALAKAPLGNQSLDITRASRKPRIAAHEPGSAVGGGRCACGGGCPRCAVPSLDPSALAGAPSGLRKVLESPGRSLDPQLQRRMEGLFSRAAQEVEAVPPQSRAAPLWIGARDSAEEKSADAIAGMLDTPETAGATGAGTERGTAADFSGIRVHTDPAANTAARLLGATAFTVGPRIVFASGQFEPDTRRGDRLLAHELAHALQQRSGPPRIARSVDDWLHGTVNVAGLSYTQALGELDELVQWLGRQTSSSADTVRIEEAVTILRRRTSELERLAAGPTRRERSARRNAPHAEAAPPARYPRILTEMTSVAYTNPAEMREEYDLVIQWLARRDISTSQRRILTAERDNLAPLLSADRARVVGERQAARVRAALTPAAEGDAHELETVARTITAISSEPVNPEVFYIYHGGERIAISREQAQELKTRLRSELERAARRLDSDADYYWGRYHAQVAINEDSPIIAGISGWLADVHDPGDELRFRYWWLHNRVRAMRIQIAAGRVVEAATMMPELDRFRQEIRSLSRAFYEGYIEGAEIAVNRLEFTRDAAFALAGSIAAVVAAPLVAGYVAGAGFTGATAGVLTIAGTGATVGTGVGVVRGASEAGGVLIAGGSLGEAAAGFAREFRRGFREGFVAGAAGGAGRLLGLAAGAGASVGEQVLIRVGGDLVVNATSTMLDVLWQTCSAGHCDVDRAVRLGLTNGLASIPGSVVGLSSSSVARYFLGPLTSGATSYVSAIQAGATPEEAMRGAGVAVASSLAMSTAQHGAEADQALEARGREAGQASRSTAAAATRRVAAGTAAIMIGVSDAGAPLRSGFGGTPVAAIDAAPAAAPVAPVHEAPAGTTSATSPASPHAPGSEAALPGPDEVFGQLGQELGIQPAQAVTGTAAQRIDESHRLAHAAGWVDPQGDPRGPVHAVVGTHGDAPVRRRVTGQTGQTRQSAHIGATSLLRTLAGYSRRLALTILMPPAQHRAFDQHWLQWIAARRRAIRASGSTTFTAPLSEVLDAQRQAIRQTPNLSGEQRGTMEWMLEHEFHTLSSGLPNGMATQVPLPAVLGS
jgi:hypothetical protein